MSNDRAPARMMGLAVPMVLTEDNLWVAESDFEQAGPQPGEIVPGDPQNRMEIRGAGSMEAGASLDVQIHRAGVAGSDLGNAEMLWKNTSDGATAWRGHDLYPLAAWQAIVWADTAPLGTDPAEAIHSHCVDLPDGRTLWTYQRKQLVGLNDEWAVDVRVRNTDGTWSAAVELFSTTTAPIDGLFPTLCLEPGKEGVQCAYWTTDGQVQIHRSKLEDLATWTLVSKEALAEGVSVAASGAGTYRLRGLRMVARNGQFSLVGRLFSNNAGADPADQMHQWASVGGLRYTLVDNHQPGDSWYLGDFDLVEHGGFFVLMYLDYDGGLQVRARRVGSAFTGFRSASAVSVAIGYGTMTATSPPVFNQTTLAACVVGKRVYLTTWEQDDYATLYYSEDYGQTWESAGRWFISGDIETKPYHLSICGNRGRFLVGHSWLANPGDEDLSFAVAQLGGSTQVTVDGWDETWLPFDLPNDTKWDVKGTATGTPVLSDGAMQIALTSNTAWYDRATNPPTNTTAQGIRFRFTVHPISGGDNATTKIFARILNGPHTGYYELTILFSTQAGTFYVVDTTTGGAGTVLATVNLQSFTGPVQILGHLGEGVAAIWYRMGTPEQLMTEDRTWTKVSLSTTPKSTTAAGPFYNNISFGQETGGSSPSIESHWYEFCFGQGNASGPLLHDQVNPDDLTGRLIESQGSAAYLSSGLEVWGHGGPAREGDSYTATPRYQYPWYRTLAHVSKSPRRSWRTPTVDPAGSDNAEQSFALQLNPNTNAEEEAFTDFIAMVGLNTNFRTVWLARRDTTSNTWEVLKQADLAEDWTLSNCTRQGRVLIAGTPSAPAVAQWVAEDDLKGWIAEMQSGGTTVYRRVLSNSSGVLSSGSSSKKARILLDGILGTEATSGITIRLIPTSWTLLIPLNGETASAYQIIIPQQGTIDDEIRAGGLWLCDMFVFGWPHSWGRIISPDHGVSREVRFDGSSRTKKAAPTRRTFRFAWTDGLDMRDLDLDDGTVDPDFFTASADPSALPVAVWDDVPHSFEGLMRRLDGPRVPVVYLDRIDRIPNGTDAVLITRRRRMIAAEITQGGQTDHVQGDEGVDEVFRVATIVGEELDV